MTHPMRIASATLAVVACVSCQPPERDAASDTNAEARPVVGRLQLQDRVLDLTVDAFGTGPDAVPNQSYANIMADVVVTKPEPARDQVRDDATRPGLRSPLR